MFKQTLMALFVGALAGTLQAKPATLIFKTKNLTAQATTRGGALDKIEFAGDNMIFDGKGKVRNFTEKALVAQGKKQVIEDFGDLDFRITQATDQSVTMSALGVKAFNWLRITKTFTLHDQTDELTVTWNLTNIHSLPHKVGFWHRTMLRRHNAAGMINTFHFSRNGKLETMTHPGPFKDDFCVLNPDRAFIAFAGKEDDKGAVLLLPETLTTAFYHWLSTTDSLSTLEWFTREQTIAPGETKAFVVRVRFSNRVSQDLTTPMVQKRMTRKAEGAEPLIPYVIAKKDKSITSVFGQEGPVVQSKQYMDLDGERQYQPSVRAVRLPAGLDTSKLAVYQRANKNAEADRPVPCKIVRLKDGQQRVLFAVPGISPKGFHYTRIGEGLAWEYMAWEKKPQGKFLGESAFHYRLCFDLPTGKTWDDSLFQDGPNLVYNGSFQKKDPKIPWPDGFFWPYAVRDRNIYHWDNAGWNDSKAMKILKPKGSKFYGNLPFYLRLEPGIKYTATCYVKAENPLRNSVLTMLIPIKADKKADYPRRVNILENRDSFPWKRLTHTFYAWEDTQQIALQFMAGDETSLWFDRVRVEPEDFPYVARTPLERERDELISTRYPFLPLIENISHDFVTPHVKWLKNTRDAMPEILYLPMGSGNSCENMRRRQIVEFSQRMDLRYRYIPLLRKIQQAKSWNPPFDKTLEKYTMLQLEAVKSAPKVIIVQGIDLTRQVQKEFIDRLRNFQLRGSNLFFFNCANIPAQLLGKPVPLPEGIFATPHLRNVSPNQKMRGCRSYLNGKSNVICFTDKPSPHYVNNRPFECVPQEQAGEMCPAYFSHEFPYWEYIYLSALKCLRSLAEVNPQVKVLGNLPKGIKIKAEKKLDAQLKVVYLDMNRETDAERTDTISLKQGINQIQLPLPSLPGGPHIAHYWLLDQQGKVYDCGALAFSTPETAPVTIAFDHPDKIYTRGEPVVCTVTVGNLPPQARLVYQVTDTHDRIVAQGRMTAEETQKIRLNLLPPYTTLYRIHAQIHGDKAIVAKTQAEFSMPTKNKDIHQVHGMVWKEYTAQLKVFADLGFSMVVTYFMQNGHAMGRFRAMRNLDLEPMSWGIAAINYSRAQSLKYRGDIPSDPVRNPCYSNPEHWKSVDQRVRKDFQNQHFDYYGIKHFEIADEAFLGSTVCFSEHCLKAFRKELQTKYSSLQQLNETWGRNVASWDDVMPVQFKELTDKDNLAPWLEHKLFMSKVFARDWVGNFKKIIQTYIPTAKVGLSGTQVPGYSYDWVQLMKHIDCLSYYSGIQRKVVHDLAASPFVAGMWGGGYAPCAQDNEFYQKSRIWEDLFLGANMLSNFAVGNSIRGDLIPVQNTLWYAELLRELRKGPARLVLSAGEIKRDIAVLYSQPSLFAAIGTIGSGFWHNSQTGAAAILNDLKYSFQYLSYEDLEEKTPDVKVIILPATLALSDRSADNLRTFVANGGTVIADFGAGCFNEHGRRTPDSRAAALFGISRQQAQLAPVTRRLGISPSEPERIPALTGEFQIGEGGLQPAGAAQLSTESAGHHAVFVNRIGKGRAILLNLPLGGYQEVNLGGVGGETSQVKTGTALFCEQMRTILKGIIETAGAEHNSTVISRNTQRLYPCQTTLRQDGENYVFGLLKPCVTAPDGKYPMKFDRKFAEKIHVRLPVSGHIYEVRRGKYLGNTNQFDLDLIPGDGQLFTVLKNKVNNLTIQAPDRLAAGDKLTVSFQAENGSGPHVFHLDMIDPDGKTVTCYSHNARFQTASGTMTFQTAFNQRPGTWKIRVRDVNTGIQAQRNLSLTARP